MAAEVFRLEGLEVVKEGRTILQVEELTLYEGEVLGVIGPNGAGKSTLLLVLAGLERPARGRIQFRGRETSGRGGDLVLRRRLAMVFQEPLLVDASVYDNVALGLRFRGLPEREVRKKVQHWLSRLGLEGLEARRARTLSGGEAQRVSLARALAVEPEVLLLDEPFAALDSPTRDALLEDLHAILNATGQTTVFVTHDFRELPFLAHRVAVMFGGRILQVASPAEVLSRPANLELAAFVGVTNRLPARIAGGEDGWCRLEADGGLVLWCRKDGNRELEGLVVACWRPEEGRLLPGAPATPARNLWPALVRRIIPLGGQDKVVLECQGREFTVLAAHHLCRELALTGGARVYLEVPPEAVHLLAG